MRERCRLGPARDHAPAPTRLNTIWGGEFAGRTRFRAPLGSLLFTVATGVPPFIGNRRSAFYRQQAFRLLWATGVPPFMGNRRSALKKAR